MIVVLIYSSVVTVRGLNEGHGRLEDVDVCAKVVPFAEEVLLHCVAAKIVKPVVELARKLKTTSPEVHYRRRFHRVRPDKLVMSEAILDELIVAVSSGKVDEFLANSRPGEISTWVNEVDRVAYQTRKSSKAPCLTSVCAGLERLSVMTQLRLGHLGARLGSKKLGTLARRRSEPEAMMVSN